MYAIIPVFFQEDEEENFVMTSLLGAAEEGNLQAIEELFDSSPSVGPNVVNKVRHWMLLNIGWTVDAPPRGDLGSRLEVTSALDTDVWASSTPEDVALKNCRSFKNWQKNKSENGNIEALRVRLFEVEWDSIYWSIAM